MTIHKSVQQAYVINSELISLSLLGLCRAESGVPGFRSGVRRTLLRASAKLLTNALRHRRCPLFAEDRADGDPKSRPEGSRPEYGVRRSEIGWSESERG